MTFKLTLFLGYNSKLNRPVLFYDSFLVFAIDSFHIVTSLSNRSSIEKSIKTFLQMKGQIAY